MVQSIEVYLQPPSPTINPICTLPSVKSLFSETMEEDERSIISEHDQQQQQQLPSIRVTEDDTSHSEYGSDHHHRRRLSFNNKLDAIEPQLDSLSISTSPYQQSPIMTFSSPSSTTSSIVGSPLISPINDGPFLLPPPDSSTLRRCRSVSNSSITSSPTNSPYTSFSFRSLSEPPTFSLPPSSTDEEDEGDDRNDNRNEDCHPIFGPKRKRGRPPNASRPEVQADSNYTFVKPTVWDVGHKPQKQKQSNNDTPQFLTENTVLSDGINTFTATNMNMALNIPKKKRGRKPKKQLEGNSCFVWRDLTAPRGANKKTLLSQKKKESNHNNEGSSNTGQYS
ncbi:uncharacterized protein B0P05DRAFT_564577 [Gilbertella persicaria]|uniref:uncharacterized protein n=1 Tax=Gilbertella persicaria TaxID=101096 RepID=UPI0022206818|nr:uncharacterized protein B0P05DRAFT_564577 [Gilbertella persicaria]KAI8048351.1 hypothetical protein B0P05DRAFT_564577 [Gilbertella persicaria]